MHTLDVCLWQKRSDPLFRHQAERLCQRIRSRRVAGYGRDAAVAVGALPCPRIEQMIETTLGVKLEPIGPGSCHSTIDDRKHGFSAAHNIGIGDTDLPRTSVRP